VSTSSNRDALAALATDTPELPTLERWAACLDVEPTLLAREASCISQRVDELAAELEDLRTRERHVRGRLEQLEREQHEFRGVLERVRAGAFGRELLRREPAELVRS
jgi:hypothetical protein